MNSKLKQFQTTYVNGIMIIYFNNIKIGYSMLQYLYFKKNKYDYSNMIQEYEYIDGHWKIIPCRSPLNLHTSDYIAINIE